MHLRQLWEENASSYLAWVEPSRDVAFWRLNLPTALQLIGAPGRCTLDVGSGEGRLSRELERLGHNVVSFDSSPTLARAALEKGSPRVVLADAGRIPFSSRAADLVVASMVLMDLDDLDQALGEVARILCPGGRFYLSVLHPLNTCGERGDDGALCMTGDYFAETVRHKSFSRGGVTMTFHSAHRPLSRYVGGLSRAGFVIEAVAEPVPSEDLIREFPVWGRWRTVPNSLHVLARLD
jgi:SAM-dependent methyltransferase